MENLNPSGLTSSAPIVTGDKDSAFGTHFDWLGVGGWRAVQNTAERDAIPVNTERMESSNSSGRRRRWMKVYCGTEAKEYQLQIADAAWNAADQAGKIALLANNANWAEVVSGSDPSQEFNPFNLSVALREAVIQGTYNEYDELTSAIPDGCIQGMNFGQYGYDYFFKPGDAGTNTWSRNKRAGGGGGGAAYDDTALTTRVTNLETAKVTLKSSLGQSTTDGVNQKVITDTVNTLAPKISPSLTGIPLSVTGNIDSPTLQQIVNVDYLNKALFDGPQMVAVSVAGVRTTPTSFGQGVSDANGGGTLFVNRYVKTPYIFTGSGATVNCQQNVVDWGGQDINVYHTTRFINNRLQFRGRLFFRPSGYAAYDPTTPIASSDAVYIQGGIFDGPIYFYDESGVLILDGVTVVNFGIGYYGTQQYATVPGPNGGGGKVILRNGARFLHPPHPSTVVVVETADSSTNVSTWPVCIVAGGASTSMPGSTFATIPLSATATIDTHAGWNGTAYVVPQTGTYHVEMNLRLIDNGYPNMSYGIGADVNMVDNAAFGWRIAPGSGSPLVRHGAIHQRTLRLNQGDLLKYYGYFSDAGFMNITTAEITITRIR